MKKKKGNAWIIWSTIIFVVLASALVISPMFTMDRTKTAAIDNINNKYNDDFMITYSNLSKTPFSDSFVAIVQSQVTGASYNVTFVDGKGDIPDYEEETYLMTFNTMAEESFENSVSMAFEKDQDVIVRVITMNKVDQAHFDAYEQKVKAQYPDVSVKVETMEVSKEVFEQMAAEIPMNYQRSVIAQEANFDNFEPVVKTFEF